MSYKPDEATLIAWMFGELEGKASEDVAHWLEQNPDEMKKIQEMRAVKNMMGSIQDKEVIAPPIFVDHEADATPYWKSSAFKSIMGIAATLLLFLVAGRLIGPEIRYNEGELRISFAAKGREDKKPAATLSPAEVQRMINATLASSTSAQESRWAESQQKLNSQIRQSLDQNSRTVNDLVKNNATASQEQLRSFVAGLQTENLRLVKDYLQLSSKDQNDYVEKLLIGFSKYMQEQRRQDLVLVQDKVNSLEKNSDQFKQETEQLLASIISSTPEKKVSE